MWFNNSTPKYVPKGKENKMFKPNLHMNLHSNTIHNSQKMSSNKMCAPTQGSIIQP